MNMYVLKSKLILYIIVMPVRDLHFIFEGNLLLFLVIMLHDFEALSLDKPAFLDIELFLSFSINLFGLLVGFLLDEGHHMLDLEDRNTLLQNMSWMCSTWRTRLFLDVCVAERHLDVR